MATQPASGEVAPGQLLVKPDDRTMWLGTDSDMGTGGSVLVSDIVGMEAAIAQCLSDANTYTENVGNTKAPLSHRHDASQIDNLDQAIQSASKAQSFAKGMIIVWWGNPENIGKDWSPTGQNLGGENMIGWVICNGISQSGVPASQIPDFNGLYLLPWTSNGLKYGPNQPIVISTQAGHNHDPKSYSVAIDPVGLTVAQMPSHAHGHSKSNIAPGESDIWLGISDGSGTGNTWENTTTGPKEYTTVSMDKVGGGETHGHTNTATFVMTAEPGHTHTHNNLAQNVPYITAVYILRVI